MSGNPLLSGPYDRLQGKIWDETVGNYVRMSFTTHTLGKVNYVFDYTLPVAVALCACSSIIHKGTQKIWSDFNKVF